MKVFVRTKMTTHSVNASHPFTAYGELFAVTRSIEPLAGFFVATHIKTGFCIPGVTEEKAKDVPDKAKARCRRAGRAKVLASIKEACKRFNIT